MACLFFRNKNQSREWELILSLLTYFYLEMEVKMCEAHINLRLNKWIGTPKSPHRIDTLTSDIKIKLLFYPQF